MHRRTSKMIIALVGCLLLAVELVLMRHQLAAALRVATGARPLWVVTAAGATIVSMQCFARTQRRMLKAADPNARDTVTLPRMVGLTYTANALNMTLPAGSAVSVGYVVTRLREWGSTNAAAVFTVVASGALSSGVFLALAAGSGLAAGTSGRTSELALAAAIITLIVGWAVRRMRVHDNGERRRRMLGRIERRLRQISVRSADALHDAADGLTAIHPRRRDWIAGAGLAALNWLADFVCLVASCHAVDMPVTAPGVLLTAYVAGMSASSIAFLPGGFGVIEVAMIAALHAGGAVTTPATAAVLLYRVISCVCVVAAGWIVWSGRAVMRHHHRSGTNVVSAATAGACRVAG